ncbi:MAG: 3-phosphoshikimate 1-carboxyvinyltransferase [gamma proteobacterium symbiont of Bathyaustriella thionipta]|nr:3-phosphoshikimate 1-carboxyvinyltransferase [gamma proteobacterium symbiont of Bathyaustriella thionipta]MCU7949235.1 3-phosphoshikimate 1-carboxyvinyltransferase [gamma proteobacterium symbiont of Bathyaustriella thionipta]MCU7954805.1 3-phosphoshikimate 1-carboxyvinyltransferase [gamma proteobacterium symbiont of Bathyaustriella thionipta]MCU7955823.1 3-phosphoshikimate 1-carboxyvinyltransferase [gamma proteobacterium symbiont of Bathyaustriella thionipta]MCU7967252.1 3-phosphoshikimate 1
MSEEQSITYIAKPGGHLTGHIRVPGDKSISHRSIMLGSLSEGCMTITGFLQGEDSLATLRAFRAMGVQITGPDEQGKVIIDGVGMYGLKAPDGPLDLGNSGTSMRLLTGLLAAQGFDLTLSGDHSLSSRPMKRVTDPVVQMGAHIETNKDGTAPLIIHSNNESQLQAINYTLPMASAQVKSCVLLAGLYAQGQTCVTEPAPTRDHTERMLQGFGYDIKVDELDEQRRQICLQGGGKLTACDIDVPSDISSAAFFMVGASISEDSDITLKHVGINPTRIGVINILQQMGADISLSNEQEVGGEPVADIRIRYAKLKGIHIPEDQVPLAIDEFPAISIAAACADGQTILTGAEELRVKESDRIQAMVDGMKILGIDCEGTKDGMIINGGEFSSGTVDGLGDHRIAMSFAMAALKAKGPVTIKDCANVNTSFPDFIGLAQSCGLQVNSKADV